MPAIDIHCPACGDTAVGTIEDLIGIAPVSGWDQETQEFTYDDSTEILWDTSTTRKDDQGRPWLICDACNEHFIWSTP